MITILEKHHYDIKPDPLMRAECLNCGSVFTFNLSDCFKTGGADSHFWTYGIRCPVCKETLNQDLCGMEGKGWKTISE